MVSSFCFVCIYKIFIFGGSRILECTGDPVYNESITQKWKKPLQKINKFTDP